MNRNKSARIERRRPFHPFQVELLDGKVIVVEPPSLTMGEDSAALIPNNDELVEFGCEEVRTIRAVPLEAVTLQPS